MELDKNQSERLDILRFPLVIGVVFVHAYGMENAPSGEYVGQGNIHPTTRLIQDVISQGIARLAVPLFFLLSGYFFFLGTSFDINAYRVKLKKRIRSLLIPFLAWNLTTLFAFFLIQSIPAAQGYFSGQRKPVKDFQLLDYLDATLGITDYPIAYQFWFIRDLMLIAVATPAIYLLLKKLPQITLLLLMLLWFCEPLLEPAPWILGALFFSAGAYFSIQNISLFVFEKYAFWVLLFYLLLLTTDALTKDLAVNIWVHKTGIVTGVFAVLYLSRPLHASITARQILLPLASYSFFVFAFHEPLLMTLRKVSFTLIRPSSSIETSYIYFACPILAIAISVAVFAVLKYLAPGFARLITGGR